MADLAIEIKQLIIDALELEDIGVEDILDKEPLFGDGLGLDSIDALELGLALKNKYQIVIDAESEETKEHFFSVSSLVAFISARLEV